MLMLTNLSKVTTTFKAKILVTLRLQSLKHMKLKGFGGTDFRPAFAYVDKLCSEKVFKKLKGLLYFTDGYGTYPASRPAYQTAFVFFEENYYDRQVPPWAIKLLIGPDDLQEVAR